jgi:hypothetical protein
MSFFGRTLMGNRLEAHFYFDRESNWYHRSLFTFFFFSLSLFQNLHFTRTRRVTPSPSFRRAARAPPRDAWAA